MRSLFSLSIGLMTAALAAATAACSTAPTPFQPYVADTGRGIHGGYSDQKLASDRFVVRFHGNEFTSRGRVEGYLLYRAAQLAVQNGFDSFVMIDRHTEHDVQTYVTPEPLDNPWYGRGYGYWSPDWSYYSPGIGWNYWRQGMGPFWHDRPDVRTVEAFEASAEVKLLKGTPSPDRPHIFDARKVMADLGPTIQLPAARR